MPSDSTTKGVAFQNKNLGTQEFFSLDELDGKSFDDIAVDLWKRLRSRGLVKAFRTDIRNESSLPERQPIRFSYARVEDDKMTYIGGARLVTSFVADTGARLIYYYADTIGGSRGPLV